MARTCLFLLLVFLVSCDHKQDESNDFAMAEKAYEQKEISDARMFYERFLRKNPVSEKRWYVWQQLLDITLNFTQENFTARSYLELMLQEFSADEKRKRMIETQIADLAYVLRDYDRAVEMWEALVADDETPLEEKATAYRKLSAVYLRRLDFSAATEGLSLCLGLSVSAATKASCLYDLATTQTLTNELESAEKNLELLLAMPDLHPDDKTLAVFLLADVYEQEEKYLQARQLYESIRDNYPNQQVISLRMQNLQKKIKK